MPRERNSGHIETSAAADSGEIPLDQPIALLTQSAVAPSSRPAGIVGLDRDAAFSQRHPALVDALDRTQFGIIVTLPAARPSFVNAYACRLLERRDGLTVSDTGLATLRAADTHALREAIDRASRRQLATCVTLLLPRAGDNRRPLVVHVPVPQYSGMSADQATVFICDPNHAPIVDTTALCRLFGMTRSEAALCALLMAGKTAEQAAECLFVSIHTVRTHLKRILSKTDTGRQAELLRLLLVCSAQVRLD
jgi:DNA-binding CsgD family transcriptional regulator